MITQFFNQNLFIVTRLASIFISQSILLLLVFYLDAADFGSLAILLAISQLLVTFLVAWHSGIVLNHGQKFFLDQKSLYTVISFRLILFISVLLILLVLSLFDINKIIDDFTRIENAIYLLILFVLAESIFDFFQNILIVYGKLIINAFSVLITKSLCFLYVLFEFTDLQSYFEFYFKAHSAYSLFVLFLLFYIDRPSVKKINIKKYKELYTFCIWALFTSISVLIANQAYNFILRWYEISFQDIGAHSLAFRALMSLSVLIYFVRVFYAKYLYNTESRKRVSYVRRVLNSYLYIYLFFASLGYLFISILVFYLIDFSNRDGYEKTMFFMLAYYPSFLLFQRGQFLSVMLQNSRFYINENLSFIYMSFSGLFLNLFFINFFGIYGVVIGTTISYLIFNILLRHYMNVSFFYSLRNHK